MARICIVSHNSAAAFIRIENGHIGGVERQTRLLADYLAELGHEVYVITWADGLKRTTQLEAGVTIVPICARRDGIPLARFFYPRWFSLVTTLNSIDADVIYHNAAEGSTGQVALWCRRRGKKFVYSVASDAACELDLAALGNWRERMLYRYALRNASEIVVQSQSQKESLASNFGVVSSVVSMPCPTPDTFIDLSRKVDPNGKILWIGRLVKLKRPDWISRLANLLPEFKFMPIIARNNESAYAKMVQQSLDECSNVDLLTNVPYDEIFRHYRESALLICTSEYEGFPNTFLEAMSMGVPIVSTFDPDGILEEYGIGASVCGIDEMANEIRAITTDEEKHARMSKSASIYFKERHQFDVAMPKLVEKLV